MQHLKESPLYGAAKWAIGGLIALIVVVSSAFTVNQYELDVVTRFGKFNRIATPGLNFKFPFVEGTTTYRTDLLSLSTPRDINKGWGESIYTVDNQEVFVIFTIQYRILAEKVPYIYENSQDLIPRVYQIARDRLKSELGKINTSRVAATRGDVRDSIQLVLQESTKDLGIVVTDFLIDNIEYDDAFKRAVTNSATARQTVEQKEQERQQAVKVAEGVVITAKGAADAVKLAGEAEAYAIRVKGQAEAQAIQAQADALRANPVLVELRKAEKWNGALPTQMIGSVMPWMNVDAAGKK